MSWDKEVGEIERRQHFAKQMGGKDGIDRQKKRGKLTVRERIDQLVDKGSFHEFMGLTGTSRYERGDLVAFTPKGSVVGTAKLRRRKLVGNSGDFTVRGGS